jgi:hypothetical protein
MMTDIRMQADFQGAAARSCDLQMEGCIAQVSLHPPVLK